MAGKRKVEKTLAYWMEAKERQQRREIKRRLEDAGWLVFSFSVHHQVESQLADWPDLVAFKDDHVLLIEAKRATGRLSDGQSQFRERLLPHLGPHVQHIVTFLPDDVDGWLDVDAGYWKTGLVER